MADVANAVIAPNAALPKAAKGATAAKAAAIVARAGTDPIALRTTRRLGLKLRQPKWLVAGAMKIVRRALTSAPKAAVKPDPSAADAARAVTVTVSDARARVATPTPTTPSRAARRPNFKRSRRPATRRNRRARPSRAAAAGAAVAEVAGTARRPATARTAPSAQRSMTAD